MDIDICISRIEYLFDETRLPATHHPPGTTATHGTPSLPSCWSCGLFTSLAVRSLETTRDRRLSMVLSE